MPLDEEKLDDAKEGVSLFIRFFRWIAGIVKRRRGN